MFFNLVRIAFSAATAFDAFFMRRLFGLLIEAMFLALAFAAARTALDGLALLVSPRLNRLFELGVEEVLIPFVVAPGVPEPLPVVGADALRPAP
jgi:hypothetical protein